MHEIEKWQAKMHAKKMEKRGKVC